MRNKIDNFKLIKKPKRPEKPDHPSDKVIDPKKRMKRPHKHK